MLCTIPRQTLSSLSKERTYFSLFGERAGRFKNLTLSRHIFCDDTLLQREHSNVSNKSKPVLHNRRFKLQERQKLFLSVDFHPPRSNNMIKAMNCVAAVLFLLLTTSVTTASTLGEDLCSCSPTIFNFTLNFSTSCPGNVQTGGGIEDVKCETLVVSDDQSNDVPVVLSTITILELNENTVINSTVLEGPFQDGDMITYASISSYQNLTNAYFPFGLRVVLNGKNSEKTTVLNTVHIGYNSNICTQYPVVPVDAVIGWMSIVSFEL